MRRLLAAAALAAIAFAPAPAAAYQLCVDLVSMSSVDIYVGATQFHVTSDGQCLEASASGEMKAALSGSSTLTPCSFQGGGAASIPAGQTARVNVQAIYRPKEDLGSQPYAACVKLL